MTLAIGIMSSGPRAFFLVVGVLLFLFAVIVLAVDRVRPPAEGAWPELAALFVAAGFFCVFLPTAWDALAVA